jgi:anthranilate/para-aminobenzoate synthase component I
LLDELKQAKIGDVIPLERVLDITVGEIDLFSSLTDRGTKKNCILFNSEDKVICSISPCLMVSGKDDSFEITALNSTGNRIINYLKKDFKYCDKSIYKNNKITGILTKKVTGASEDVRLKTISHFDILETIANKFKTGPISGMGLYGLHTANLNKLKKDSDVSHYGLDYLFYFLDNYVEIQNGKAKLVANVLITDNKKELAYNGALKLIKVMEDSISKKPQKTKNRKKIGPKLSYDQDDSEFLNNNKSIAKYIQEGKVLFCNLSRGIFFKGSIDPYKIFLSKSINCSFFINDGANAYIDTGDESISFQIDKSTTKFKVKICTSKFSHIDGWDDDILEKAEALLRVSEYELSYSMVALDNARNNVSRVSENLAKVSKLMHTDKDKGFLKIYSLVEGKIRSGLSGKNVLSMMVNSPIVPSTASDLLNKVESSRKGPASDYLISIRSNGQISGTKNSLIRVVKDMAYVQTSARIFPGSDEDKVLKSIKKKEFYLIEALKGACD